MRIFGKSLRDHLDFGAPVMIFVATVAVLRLGLSLAGASLEMVKYLSPTWAMILGILYFGVRVHTSGFGSFMQLLPLAVLTNVCSHWVAALAIVIGVIMGTDNVYTLPEFSGDADGKTAFHAVAHFVFGPLGFGLFGWAVSALVMLLTKLVKRPKEPVASADSTAAAP